MWWPVVFWILLIPLIVVEFIIYLKSRKFTWLVYALAIFTYVISVTYTIDVFSLNKNVVIIILLLSAGLMVLLGRQFSRKPSKDTSSRKNAIIALVAIMALLFIVSIIFGKAHETVMPANSIAKQQIVVQYDDRGTPKPTPNSGVVVLTRKVSNSFFLPVPIKSKNYRMCLQTTQGVQELGNDYSTTTEEVGPGQTKTVEVRAWQATLQQGEQPKELLIYEQESNDYSYAPCNSLTIEPNYRIPVA